MIKKGRTGLSRPQATGPVKCCLKARHRLGVDAESNGIVEECYRREGQGPGAWRGFQEIVGDELFSLAMTFNE